ncbi:MAG: hypothetical protein GXP36_14970 [Actinobacteria bacterium]|nr:hypothetical protein [Actinomycetota bacterium]
MKRLPMAKLVVVFAIIAASCGGGADMTTSTVPAAAAAPATSTTVLAATEESDVPACLRVWPEDRVQDVTEGSFTLLSSSPDGRACIFNSGASSVAIFMRPGDQSLLDQAETGAGLAGGVEDQAICDGGYSTTVGEIVVVEALDLDKALIFNVALSGVDDPIAAAKQLLGDACS